MNAQTRISSVPESTVRPGVRVLMPSPLGPLGVELLGTVVTRVAIEPGDASSYIPLHQVDGPDDLDEVFGHLAEYFAGARRKLDVGFDLCASGISVFSRRVLKEVTKVPYGRTRTSREIAEACGRHQGCPEVLSALRENPIPVVVPCHRVLADDGGLGEYVGGGRRKRWLLDLERQGPEPL